MASPHVAAELERIRAIATRPLTEQEKRSARQLSSVYARNARQNVRGRRIHKAIVLECLRTLGAKR